MNARFAQKIRDAQQHLALVQEQESQFSALFDALEKTLPASPMFIANMKALYDGTLSLIDAPLPALSQASPSSTSEGPDQERNSGPSSEDADWHRSRTAFLAWAVQRACARLNPPTAETQQQQIESSLRALLPRAQAESRTEAVDDGQPASINTLKTWITQFS